MKELQENRFTGLIITWQDNSSYELALVEQDGGTFKVEDDMLKIEFFNKDGVKTQMGFPFTSFRCYEICYDTTTED
jgi:hypothetical protein